MIKIYIHKAIITINKMNNKDALVLLLFQRAQKSIAIPYCLLVSIIKRYNNLNLVFILSSAPFIFMKKPNRILKIENQFFYRYFKNSVLKCLFVIGLFRNNLFTILLFSMSVILIILLNFVCCPRNHFRKRWMDMNSF